MADRESQSRNNQQTSYMRVLKNGLLAVMAGMLTASCSSYIEATGVAYQSLRSTQEVTGIPEGTTLVVHSVVNANGVIDVIVENRTDEVMVIDRTKTFFRGTSGTSVPYYDPTVRTNTTSTTNSGTTGATVNVGAVAGAMGMGGALGRALNGVNVGGSNTTATTNVNTTYYIDQPSMSIAPHSMASLGRLFTIDGVGCNFLAEAITQSVQDVAMTYAHNNAYATCNLSIAYSLDEGKSYDRMQVDYYANTLLIGKVKQTGKVNDALRTIYANKSDCLQEPWFLLYFSSKHPGSYVSTTELINYK